MDGFDLLPDSLILQILNYVSDVKTLIRLGSVSKHFNSLVPHADSLLLRVDRVISPESDSESHLFSLLRSLLHFFFLQPSAQAHSHSPRAVLPGPVQILSRFHSIRHLQIELPSGDLKLEKGVSVKWRAEYGKTLRSCVILGFRDGDTSASDVDLAGGLKTRVVWTISALIAASARHFLLKEVIRNHPEVKTVILKDREGEGVVVMRGGGVKECLLEGSGDSNNGSGISNNNNINNRTVVPSVRMRMRHKGRVTLVVVRPCLDDGGEVEDDSELVLGAFGNGEYGDAVRDLLKSKSYLLEMNSF